MRTFIICMIAPCVLSTACVESDGAPSDSSSSEQSSTRLTSAASTSTTTTPNGVSTGPISMTSSTSSSTTSSTSTTSRPTTTQSCLEPATTGNAETGSMGFEFRDDSYCDYAQVDRTGFPLVTTLLIDSVDAYNQSTPAQDLTLSFFVEVNSRLMELHPELDAEIQALGLTPCSFGGCNAQLTDVLVPDVLSLDPDGADAFPNGRRLEEPAMDLVLALMLLDLDLEPLEALADEPLGPPVGDVASLPTWPYVAGPQ